MTSAPLSQPGSGYLPCDSWLSAPSAPPDLSRWMDAISQPVFPLCRQWLEDALRENEPGSCFVFLVGTKKDLLVSTAE